MPGGHTDDDLPLATPSSVTLRRRQAATPVMTPRRSGGSRGSLYTAIEPGATPKLPSRMGRASAAVDELGDDERQVGSDNADRLESNDFSDAHVSDVDESLLSPRRSPRRKVATERSELRSETQQSPPPKRAPISRARETPSSRAPRSLARSPQKATSTSNAPAATTAAAAAATTAPDKEAASEVGRRKRAAAAKAAEKARILIVHSASEHSSSGKSSGESDEDGNRGKAGQAEAQRKKRLLGGKRRRVVDDDGDDSEFRIESDEDVSESSDSSELDDEFDEDDDDDDDDDDNSEEEDDDDFEEDNISGRGKQKHPRQRQHQQQQQHRYAPYPAPSTVSHSAAASASTVAASLALLGRGSHTLKVPVPKAPPNAFKQDRRAFKESTRVDGIRLEDAASPAASETALSLPPNKLTTDAEHGRSGKCQWHGCADYGVEVSNIAVHVAEQHIVKTSAGFECRWGACKGVVCKGAPPLSLHLIHHLGKGGCRVYVDQALLLRHYYYPGSATHVGPIANVRCPWRGCGLAILDNLVDHICVAHLRQIDQHPSRCRLNDCRYTLVNDTESTTRARFIKHIMRHFLNGGFSVRHYEMQVSHLSRCYGTKALRRHPIEYALDADAKGRHPATVVADCLPGDPTPPPTIDRALLETTLALLPPLVPLTHPDGRRIRRPYMTKRRRAEIEQKLRRAVTQHQSEPQQETSTAPKQSKKKTTSNQPPIFSFSTAMSAASAASAATATAASAATTAPSPPHRLSRPAPHPNSLPPNPISATTTTTRAPSRPPPNTIFRTIATQTDLPRPHPQHYPHHHPPLYPQQHHHAPPPLLPAAYYPRPPQNSLPAAYYPRHLPPPPALPAFAPPLLNLRRPSRLDKVVDRLPVSTPTPSPRRDRGRTPVFLARSHSQRCRDAFCDL